MLKEKLNIPFDEYPKRYTVYGHKDVAFKKIKVQYCRKCKNKYFYTINNKCGFCGNKISQT